MVMKYGCVKCMHGCDCHEVCTVASPSASIVWWCKAVCIAAALEALGMKELSDCPHIHEAPRPRRIYALVDHEAVARHLWCAACMKIVRGTVKAKEMRRRRRQLQEAA